MTISTRCWRAVLVLAAIQFALAALALAGLAKAQDREKPAPEVPAESVTMRILLSAPRHVSDLDEEDGQRAARLKAIASAIDTATPSAHERALLLSVAWHESRFASYVDLDLPQCRDGVEGVCDAGRAWSIYQLHGQDRTGDRYYAADVAIRMLRYHADRCGHPGLTTAASVRAGVSGYATGGRLCRWVGAEKRVQTWRRYLARMGGVS